MHGSLEYHQFRRVWVYMEARSMEELHDLWELVQATAFPFCFAACIFYLDLSYVFSRHVQSDLYRDELRKRYGDHECDARQRKEEKRGKGRRRVIERRHVGDERRRKVKCSVSVAYGEQNT